MVRARVINPAMGQLASLPEKCRNTPTEIIGDKLRAGGALEASLHADVTFLLPLEKPGKDLGRDS